MYRAAVLALAAVLPFAAACRGMGSTNAAAPRAQAAAPQAAATAADPNAFTGTVAETMNSGGYTYARLQALGRDDVWIAASEFPAKTGDRLTVALTMPMQNFKSKTLARTFPTIYFVSDVARDSQQVTAPALGGATPTPMTSHAPVAGPTSVEPVAPAPGGISIADVWAKRAALAGQEITVRGKVVKVNEQIMGRNWIHLQDGSGAAAARTNDLTITTEEVAKVGDLITVKGVLAIDRDFGAGYAYGAFVENGKVTK